MKNNQENPIKVLFADDDREIIEIIKDFFDTHFPEIELTTVVNGYLALQKVRSEYFHVLITDFDMPVASGLDIVRGLKTLSKALRPSGVILLSSYLTEGEPDSDLSFVNFVHKDEYREFLLKYFQEKTFLTCVNDGASLRENPRYSLERRQIRVDINFDGGTSFGILKELSLSGLSMYIAQMNSFFILGAQFLIVLELEVSGEKKAISFDVEMVGQGKDERSYLALKFTSLGRSDFDFLKSYLRQNF